MPLTVYVMSAEAPAHTLPRSLIALRHDCVTCQVPTMSPPHADTVAQLALPPVPPVCPPPPAAPPAPFPAAPVCPPPPLHDVRRRAAPIRTRPKEGTVTAPLSLRPGTSATRRGPIDRPSSPVDNRVHDNEGRARGRGGPGAGWVWRQPRDTR